MPEWSFSQQGAPLIVAHRGASATEAENTLPAFEAAVTAGAEVIEFDVRLTADGEPVVMHDPDVHRTTDGRGLVRDLTLAEIGDLRIATAGGGTTGVPTLDETLRALSGRAAVDIEIKNIPGEPGFDAEREEAVEATVRALERTGFSGSALLSSFNPFSIARARTLNSQIPTGLLTERDVDAQAAFGFAHRQGHGWVLPFVDRVTEAGPAFVADVHAVGMRLGTWITDDPAEAIALMRAGVDAIATNDPAAIVAARLEAFA